MHNIIPCQISENKFGVVTNPAAPPLKQCDLQENGQLKAYLPALAAFILLAGCSSTATHGILTRQFIDPGDLIENARTFQEIGPIDGRRCRFFFLNIFPWGDSTTGAAMDKALQGTDGDAVINATVITSLYGFVPIYNVLSFTCTTVRGIAIRID